MGALAAAPTIGCSRYASLGGHSSLRLQGSASENVLEKGFTGGIRRRDSEKSFGKGFQKNGIWRKALKQVFGGRTQRRDSGKCCSEGIWGGIRR